VGIAADVLQNLTRTGERFLRENHPLASFLLIEESLESRPVGVYGPIAFEHQFRAPQEAAETLPEVPAQVDVEEKLRTGRVPARKVVGQRPVGDDEVNVRMCY